MMRRTGQAMSGLAVALDQREAIARQEHTEAIRRLRVVCGIAKVTQDMENTRLTRV